MDEKIEEMAKIISSDTCDKDCSNRCAFCGANAKKEAKNLYNAGYRKESDTAREILEMYRFEDTFSSFQEKVAKKYGVDLGE